MRREKLAPLSYYHIYNRGNQKQELFLEEIDYARFIYLLLFFQVNEPVSQINRKVKKFYKRGVFTVDGCDRRSLLLGEPLVQIVNFCIMPNHFHMTLQGIADDGISLYMHRIGNAYGKYFNTKYEKSGHVFQGAFKAKRVISNEHLNYLSAYIHNNPKDLPEWHDGAEEYPWSSYQDYDESRWLDILNTSIVREQFNTFEAYKKFVHESGAKTKEFLSQL